MEKLHLISGMPRSGSTLLCNLLNMNPRFHATSTSPIIDVIKNIKSVFSHNITFKANNRLNLYDNMRCGVRGFLEGFYGDKKVVFDKSRGWVNKLPLLDEIMGNKQSKVIWTYRNPVDVISSIEKHYQKHKLLENTDEFNGADYSTLDIRVNNLISDDSIVVKPVWLLDDAFNIGLSNRILLVSYDSLTKEPQKTLDVIHDFIGEERYHYSKNDFKDLKQTTEENDLMYNYKFPHTIVEGGVKYVKHEHNIPDYLVEKINSRFTWVDGLDKL